MRLPIALLLVSATASAAPRDVPAFHALDLAGVIDADVTVGPAARVDITGDPDDVAKVETRVEAGVLVIRTRDRIRGKLHATITTPQLTGVGVSGVGTLCVTKISSASFSASLSGVGDVELSGSTRALQATVSGSGALRAKQLAAESTTVELSGAGNATVQATHSLAAAISGVGDIVAYGHPATVSKSITGVGHLAMK